MNLDDIKCFLEMGGAALHNSWLSVPNSQIFTLIRWGFIRIMLTDFYPDDWPVFLKLLEQVPEDQLEVITSKISLSNT
ncbi:MAG: hypothetical protein DRO88_08920 [Promethearchaeia archaeon]|nr:MAG: hypothetical protein DRO88_08920 [Candidatus Lokiarchaeia archaeon]